jgi:hypothetical protein
MAESILEAYASRPPSRMYTYTEISLRNVSIDNKTLDKF